MRKAMERTTACLLLDWHVMKKQWRFWSYFFWLSFSVSYFTGKVNSADTAIILSLLFPCMCLLPILQGVFQIEDRDRLKTLYAGLPLTRNDMVRGRYMSVIIGLMFLLLWFLLAGLLISLRTPTTAAPTRGISFALALVFLAGSSFSAFNHLLIFKWGYNFAMIADVVLTVILFSSLVGSDWAKEALLRFAGTTAVYPATVLALAFALGGAMLYLSYRLSLKAYRRRDL